MKSIKSLIYFVLLIAIIGSIHFLLTKDQITHFTIQTIYFFNFSISFIIFVLLFLVNQYFTDKVGYAFLGLGIIKMAVSVQFLMPFIQSDFTNKTPDTLNFFICFFVFLTIESLFAIQLLNKKQK